MGVRWIRPHSFLSYMLLWEWSGSGHLNVLFLDCYGSEMDPATLIFVFMTCGSEMDPATLIFVCWLLWEWDGSDHLRFFPIWTAVWVKWIRPPWYFLYELLCEWSGSGHLGIFYMNCCVSEVDPATLVFFIWTAVWVKWIQPPWYFLYELLCEWSGYGDLRFFVKVPELNPRIIATVVLVVFSSHILSMIMSIIRKNWLE